MYVNWAHYYIPKVDSVLSFLINPLFIFIVLNEKKLCLGNYKYLLLYFSLFNMSCSLCDVLVPFVVHDYRYSFTVFISDGPFKEYSPLNQVIPAIRCGFISGTYAILHAHFVYRFMVLFRGKLLQIYFLPYGIIICILYLLCHFTYCVLVGCFLINADDERRAYVHDNLYLTYQVNTFQINLMTLLFREGSDSAVLKSFIGIGIVTFVSGASVLLYIIIGFATIRKLNSHALVMSKETKRLQRQLMHALIVQSAIPTVVSFLPCVVVWYQPMFGVNLGRWSLHISCIAISVFPFLDPLAILLFVPTFRKRLFGIFCGWRQGKLPNEQRRAVPIVDENVFSLDTMRANVRLSFPVTLQIK